MSFSMVCTGCGAPLQMDSPGERGYISGEAFLHDQPLCRRCYRLIHYGEFAPAGVTEDDYRSAVMRALERPSLLLYVIDAFDFSGSLVRGLSGVLGRFEAILAVNKFDLFPLGTSAQKLEGWALREAARAGVSAREAVALSAKSGFGFVRLEEILRERSRDRQIVVIGMANVGKSSVLNRLLSDIPAAPGTRFTASPYPGTTLGALAVKISGGPAIVDTPGLLGGFRLQDRVCLKSLAHIVPTDRLRPRVYQLESGQTLFLGGLARLDFVAGGHQPFVVYAANQLRVHRTKLERADELYARQLGGFLTPPCADCRDDLRRLRPKNMSFTDGKPVDVVVPGLGWIRLSGRAVKLRIHLPEGIEAVVRPALFSGSRRPMPGSRPPAVRGAER